MPTFKYSALDQGGEIVGGSIVAATASEVDRRMEYLDLIPIAAVAEERLAHTTLKAQFALFSAPRPEDVTNFTGELAVLLRTGTQINHSLELLASDPDIGRMRKTVAAVSNAILSGESFADALSRHSSVFPPIYVALARVGEASGNLGPILDALHAERRRAQALNRRITDSLRYPVFLIFMTAAVQLFFLLFVLPQFTGILKDSNAKLDPMLVTALRFSDFLRGDMSEIATAAIAVLCIGFLLSRRPGVRAVLGRGFSRLPLVNSLLGYWRTVLFCRNLGLLLSSGVTLPLSLRILAALMAPRVQTSVWSQLVDEVRQGGKLCDALAKTRAMPTMAVRILRLGEEFSQLPISAGRVADVYDAKLLRSLDRLVGITGPALIVIIGLMVGGLIISIMTALLSLNQIAE